jgi:hypothetical protein
VSCLASVRLVERVHRFVIEAGRADHEFAVLPWSGRHHGGEVQRRRHHEAVVVVGVLADQIDAAGRTEEAGLLVVMAQKALDQAFAHKDSSL